MNTHHMSIEKQVDKMQGKITMMILGLVGLLSCGQVLGAPKSMPMGDLITNLKYTPGPFTTVLHSIAKDPHGFLRLGHDGVLRSFAADGTTVLDYRQLDASQTSRFAPDGRAVLAEDTLLYPKNETATPSITVSVPPYTTDPASVPPEIVGSGCSPPLACRNSTTCGGGCVSCTYLGFFPYGLCLSG